MGTACTVPCWAALSGTWATLLWQFIEQTNCRTIIPVGRCPAESGSWRVEFDPAHRNQCVLVTTLTKRMSEDFANVCIEGGVRCHYMHSEIETLDRIKLLQDLRNDEYDLIRINPLCEDLDLSEILLVAYKESLRSQESLIQIRSSTDFLPSPGAG